jgi:hypothetical protein
MESAKYFHSFTKKNAPLKYSRRRLHMLASFIALLMKFFSSTANVKLLLAALAKLSAALS